MCGPCTELFVSEIKGKGVTSFYNFLFLSSVKNGFSI